MIQLPFFKVCVFFLLLFIIEISSTSKDIIRQRKLPPCRSCKTFIESFQREMKRTEKGKYEGGDAAWEEQKLGSYATSEIRLVEIQEKVCSDVEEGRDQCYTFHELYDTEIENWWFNHQTTEPSLFKHFCIKTIKLCCPELHYGENCTPCAGYPDKVCNNNGKCKGAGTRKGDGKCHCDPGYIGDYCNSCASNYFEEYKDDSKMLCSRCHQSCEGTCKAAGPTGCDKCTAGWLAHKEKGCIDINECSAPRPLCTPLQFCVNTEGSYNCLECDKSCASCTGDGPDMCINCAKEYTLQEGMCVDAAQLARKQYVSITRYLTYLGLCIATCIIFQRNVAIAAVIGLSVAIYISVSEYMLNQPPTPNSIDLINTMK